MTILTSKSRLFRSNTPVAPLDPSPVVDPNYTDVVSLLRCNGTNGSTSILDEKGATVTNNGSPSISTSRFKWGVSSLLLNGSSSCTVVDPTTTTFVFTNNLTIEFWLYLTAYPATDSFAFYLGNENNGRLQVIIRSNGVIALDFFGFGEILTSSTNVVTLNSWHHIAVSRYQPAFVQVLNLFVDGISIGVNNIGDTIGNSGGYTLGSSLLLSNYLTCNIDDVRITKNVARYNANFTPPATPFANF